MARAPGAASSCGLAARPDGMPATTFRPQAATHRQHGPKRAPQARRPAKMPWHDS
jgi:hypothetical protein